MEPRGKYRVALLVAASLAAMPANGTSVKVSGKVVHLMYSASATADAHTRVAQFLEEHLR
jgi:hypothetical protein